MTSTAKFLGYCVAASLAAIGLVEVADGVHKSIRYITADANAGPVRAAAPVSSRGKVAVLWASEGGAILDYESKYAKLRTQADQIQIHGVCASACTYLFGYYKRDEICVTDKALFGFHSVYNIAGQVTPREAYFTHKRMYPEWLLEKLEGTGWNIASEVDNVALRPFGMVWLTGYQLGLKVCGPLREDMKTVDFLP